ncbi:MAG: alpha/beta hydrolase [Acidimicrobiales bacterium]
MTRFVLVHSPLVGPLTWARVGAALERRGHDVVIPELHSKTPPYWEHYADQVAAVVEESDVPVVLVAHSGAGAILPVVGHSLGDVGAYLFVDAVLPRNNTASIATMHPALRTKLMGLAGDGMLPPWHQWWDPAVFEPLIPDDALRAQFVAELEPVPVALLDEVIPDVDDWPDAPCGYLRLSKAYELEEAHAARAGWAVSRIDGRHLGVLTEPDEVTTRLLALLVRLGAGG